MGELLIADQLLRSSFKEGEEVNEKIKEAIKKLESLRVEDLSGTQRVFLIARIKTFLSVFDDFKR
ncbi:MAG TPA: hypothetical protein ENJ27_00055 [Candidatus Moranbacteria bacterium]|nr:hypothetical protein [Candidatus Moranbacteria bacterium]